MKNDKWHKYINFCNWLENRYKKDGILILSIGGIPSKYSAIECAYFKKYLA
jgi:hypothetical protein